MNFINQKNQNYGTYRNVLAEFEEWVKSRGTKIGKKVVDFINRDILDLTLHTATNYCEINTAFPWEIPDYVYKQYILFCRQKGYHYLGEEVQNVK